MHGSIQLLLVFLLSFLAGQLPAQDLTFSLRATVAGPYGDADQNSVWTTRGGSLHQLVPDQAWCVLFGDRDGNGTLDDAPANVDALHDAGLGVARTFLSLDVNTTIPGAPTLLDGDVFFFDAAGMPTLHHAESEFAQWTGCSSIDVDAYAEDANGTIWFSFADDETTTDPALIARNGGSARIDEQAIFRKDPANGTAHLAFTQPEVVAVFNQALGLGVSSVVDVIGIALDPAGQPGDLLLTSASTSTRLRGLVVSTRTGGVPHLHQGATLDAASLGFAAGASFDALTAQRSTISPQLHATPGEGSSAIGGSGRLEVHDLVPGTPVQLVLTRPLLSPQAFPIAGASGVTSTWNDPTDPVFWTSWGAAPWRLTAMADGTAAYDFDFVGLPPSTSVVVTAVDLSRGAVSMPIAVTIRP